MFFKLLVAARDVHVLQFVPVQHVPVVLLCHFKSLELLVNSNVVQIILYVRKLFEGVVLIAVLAHAYVAVLLQDIFFILHHVLHFQEFSQVFVLLLLKIITLDDFGFDEGVSEFRNVFILKVGKFFEKSGQLDHDYKDVVVVRVEMHVEELQALVVLGHGVVAIFLQQLPVEVKAVLGLVFEQQQENVYVGNLLLQLEVFFALEVVVDLLLLLSQVVLAGLYLFRNQIMQFLLTGKNVEVQLLVAGNVLPVYYLVKVVDLNYHLVE